MTPELTYFLKVNTGIMLFYLFYRMFFSKDTFFRTRRVILLGFFAISLIYPLLNIEEWARNQEPLLEMAQIYATTFLPEVEIGTQEVQGSYWWQTIPAILFYIYLAGVILLSIRLLIQLSGIILLNWRCNKERIREIQVRILKKDAGPFSFFKWIFIYPFKHDREEIDEILLHEQTHADQWHSMDVLFSELVTLFFWFNPFVWLTKKEIRNNLEYLADKKVVDSGFDSRKYQYHLLELTQKQVTAPLYNSFKILPLKNRIRMMNKKRTSNILRTKYLAIIPLVIVLLMISHIETIARSTINLAKDVIQDIEVQFEPEPVAETFVTEEPVEEEILTSVPEIETREIVAVENPVASAPTPPLTPAEEEVFMVVEQMPEYPGGMRLLMEFLSKNIKYPTKALEAGTTGRVIVQFVVEKDGSIKEAQVIKGVDPLLDQEALRVVSAMPNWNPGKQRGKTVRVKFTLPIQFKIAEENTLKEAEITDNGEEATWEIPRGIDTEESDNLLTFTNPLPVLIYQKLPDKTEGINFIS